MMNSPARTPVAKSAQIDADSVRLSASSGEAATLLDLLYPGFYMMFLLRNRYAPADAVSFRERVKQLLDQVDREARKLLIATEDVYHAKFAFCALVDEVLLTSKMRVRGEWERSPLQLELFGEHMAGQRFFDMLDGLRPDGARTVQVLEVFHMCLLLGFQGRYGVDGNEKLSYLTARLGDDITHWRGRRAPFAPHWAPPDAVRHKLRSNVPVWAMVSLFAAMALVAFLGLRSHLRRLTEADLARYTDIVKVAPQPAFLVITLP